MLRCLGLQSVTSVLLGLLLVGLAPGSALAIEVGEEAPDFSLTDLDGLEHTLSGYSSHPVLLMFLACDTDVSHALAPLVQIDLQEVYASEDFRVLGIESGGGSLEEVTQFRNVTGVHFPLLLDGAETRLVYDVPATSFVLVDGSSVVRYLSLGPGQEAYDPQALRSAIDEILRESNETNEATWGLIKSLYSD